MGSMKHFLLASALAAGFGGQALAADLLPPPPVIEGSNMEALAEFGTGWYIRGDIGYVAQEDAADVPYGRGVILNDFERMKDSFSLGAGFGYKFTNWFRSDLTADYRFDSDFDAMRSRSGYAEDYTRHWGKFEATTVLLNGYVDLPSFYGITPYVGAGIGFAETRLFTYSTELTCLTVRCGDTAPGATYTLGSQGRSDIAGGTQHNLAWALMGGIAADIGAGFKLDVGYRYTQIGDARTKLNGAGVGTQFKDLSTHEVRAGLRYMID